MVVKKILKFVWEEFNYGGHFISLGIVSIISASAVLLNIKISWEFLLAVYFINNTIYLFNYFGEFSKDEISKPERSLYTKKNIKFIPFIILFYIIIICSLVVYAQEWKAMGFGFFLLLMGFLYTVSFKKITKYLPGFKNIFVALTWSLIVLFLAFFYHYSINLSLGILFIFIFLIIFFHEIIFDIRDVAEDKKSGLLTFPVILNETALNTVLFVLTFFAAVLIAFGALNNLLSLPALSFLFIVPCNYLIFRQIKNKINRAVILIYIENILFFPLIFISNKLL